MHYLLKAIYRDLSEVENDEKWDDKQKKESSFVGEVRKYSGECFLSPVPAGAAPIRLENVKYAPMRIGEKLRYIAKQSFCPNAIV